MKLIRTDKEFSKENLPLDFLRRATSIGGVHPSPLKYEIKDFEVIESWKGVKPGSSIHPWNDEHAKEGWDKGRDKSTTRWKNFQQFGEHISQINFNELSDNNLLIVFERIIRQINKQM